MSFILDGDHFHSDSFSVEEMNKCMNLMIRFRSGSVTLKNLCSSKSPQLKLPRLPVPALQDTLKKYLKSVKPFLNDDELKITQGKIEKFGAKGGVGETLQCHLLEKAKNSDNWLEEWWLRVAYLGFRSPVPIYSSPGLVFPHRKFENEDDKLSYASKLVTAAINYKLLIDQSKIPQEMMGKNPLDMTQYSKIFGTCRIPKKPNDELVFNPNSKHIIVIHNNHFFKMNVLSKDNNQLSGSQLLKKLKEIVDQSKDCGPPIGLLTSVNRDKWSDAYAELLKDRRNEEALKALSSSLFTLSLDKSCFKSASLLKCQPDHMNLAGMQTVIGGGPNFNGGNRWFDKTIQFVIDDEGHNGLTYEHSPSEGQPIAVMMDHIVKYVDSFKGLTGSEAVDDSKPEKLEFFLTDILNEAISDAKKDLAALLDNIEMDCFKFTIFGKEFIKGQKLSPDSFIQMALQYAFYRIHRVPGAHYESASTRMFYHGRTETIRSCSVESIHFCATMLNSCASDVEKAQALKSAISAHKDYTNQALQGLGVDRHLLGLKMVAIENNIPLPELYSDVSYSRSTHLRISTSQVASLCDGFMVYGALVEDGYSCCYNPRAHDINFGTMKFTSCSETCIKTWREAIISSLLDMKNVLENAPQAKL